MGVTPRRNTHRTFAVPRTNFGKKRSWAAITCALAKQLARAPLSLAAGTCAGNSVELLRESAAITCCASTCRLVSTQNVKTSTAPRHAHSDRKRLQSSPHAACPGTNQLEEARQEERACIPHPLFLSTWHDPRVVLARAIELFALP